VSVRINCVIAGAGVIGLAVGRALALSGRNVLVLEQAEAFGTLTSSRNSEVIHAGLYYEPGSLKAKTCVTGRRELYQYLESRHIGHKRVGKLIVAQNDAELAKIRQLADRGKTNGVEGLMILDGSQTQKMEPALQCVGSLYSQQTGIIDSHEFMQALESDIESAGSMVVYRAPIISGEAQADHVVLRVGGADPTVIQADSFVNATGYNASQLSENIDGIGPDNIPETRYCKGNYFTLSGKAPFSRLIYPAPAKHGLGVHLTLDMGGQSRFGPDTEWIDVENYEVDPERADQFYGEIRKYWPGMPDGVLQPGYAGIRPKIFTNGNLHSDFMIKTPDDHGAPVVALYGIESPGLTASLAIGEIVKSILLKG